MPCLFALSVEILDLEQLLYYLPFWLRLLMIECLLWPKAVLGIEADCLSSGKVPVVKWCLWLRREAKRNSLGFLDDLLTQLD